MLSALRRIPEQQEGFPFRTELATGRKIVAESRVSGETVCLYSVMVVTLLPCARRHGEDIAASVGRSNRAPTGPVIDTGRVQSRDTVVEYAVAGYCDPVITTIYPFPAITLITLI